MPPFPAPTDDLDPDLLDLRDPDDRALVIGAAHPELDVTRETAIVGGREINPRLHLVIHEVVLGAPAPGRPGAAERPRLPRRRGQAPAAGGACGTPAQPAAVRGGAFGVYSHSTLNML